LADIKDFRGLFIVLSELDRALLVSIDKTEFTQVQNLLTNAGGLLWVTRGATMKSSNPNANMVLGLLRTIRSERMAIAVTLDLDPDSRLDLITQAELIENAFRRSVLSNKAGAECEFSEKDGQLVVPRLVVDEDMNLRVHRELGPSIPYAQDFTQPGRPLQLATCATIGGLIEEPSFRDAPFADELAEDEIEVQVIATKLSRDDLSALPSQESWAALPERSCSGVVTRVGRRVSNISPKDYVCLLAEGVVGTHACAHASSAIHIPKGIIPEAAALIPSIYGTAYYALAEVAGVGRGERVFIHMNGDSSLAAVHIARHMGAEVLVVMGRNDKRETVAKICGVEMDRVFNAESMYFARELADATQNHGVDVVFTVASNSAEAAVDKETIFDVMAPFGRIVEIARPGSQSARPRVAENITFTSINMPQLASTRPQVMEAVLRAVMQMCTKDVSRLFKNTTMLPMSHLRQGVNMIQQSALSLVLVTPKEDEQVKVRSFFLA
jgi:NADPH:quinone reductase-like Zn-dependent oxidoreductase